MIEFIPVQVGVFIDEVPSWLGPALIFFGLECLLATFISRHLNRIYQHPPQEFRIAIWLVILGTLFLTTGFSQVVGIAPLFAFLLLFFGRMIEGAAAIRLLRKVEAAIESSRSSGPTLPERLLNKLLSKFRYRALTGFVILVAYAAISYTILFGPLHQSLQYDIALYWTVMVFTLSIMGLSWKLSDIQSELGSPLLLGLFLCVGGAEVFNFQFIGNLVTIILGTIGHFVGLVLAIFFYLFSR
jgi:hypothetical protein